METKFNFNSQVCTSRSQSEKLLALGLKRETADMVWNDNALIAECEDWRPLPIYADWEEWQKDGIPAWSLGRLLEVMRMKASAQVVPLDDTFDRLIEGIETRIKEGYFNKEYLNGND